MIGIFDSGIGGLSIYQEIKALCPNVDIIYLSDSVNFPYGEKSQEVLDQIVDRATETLLSYGVDTVVLACNSATVSSIGKLRRKYSEVRFVGIEPAVKLAAKVTKNGKIGVLATKKTVKTHESSDLAPGSLVYSHHSSDLIDKIESDFSNLSREDLSSAISPLIEKGVDTIVLGCTHFYFVKGRLASEFREVTFVEPSEHVAKEVIHEGGVDGSGKDVFLTTGAFASFRGFVTDIIGVNDADIRKI